MDAPSLFDLAEFHDADAARRDLVIFCFDDQGRHEQHWILAQTDDQAWEFFRRRRRELGDPVAEWEAPGILARCVSSTEPITRIGLESVTRTAAAWLLDAEGPGFWFSSAVVG